MPISGDKKVRLILIIIGIGLGLILGEVTNGFCFMFTGLVLGLGDSAPDWYFNIQKTVQTTMTVVVMLLTIIWLQLFFNIRKTEDNL
jgi:hypothetical protein